MRAGSEARRAIVGAMVGLLYGAVLALLSAFLFGGGHGISTPLLLSSAPVGVFALAGKLVGEPYVGYGYNATLVGTPLVWAALGSLVALSDRGKGLRLTQVLALLHYASGLALVATLGEQHPELLLREDILIWTPAYLAGQVVLWSSLQAASESRRATIGAMVGLLYGSILSFLSLFAAGGGHGTGIPFLLSSAPLDVFTLAAWRVGASDVGGYALLLSPPLVWAALGSLAALSGRGKSLRLTQILALLHYCSGLALVATSGAELLPLPSFVNVYLMVNVLVWATVYLAGQVALWWRISSR